jgi:hypothetical protein
VKRVRNEDGGEVRVKYKEEGRKEKGKNEDKKW